MVGFVAYIIAVALAAAFVLSLLAKWKIIEWMQIHAPNDFIHKLLMCKFCCSWWISVLISVPLAMATGEYELLSLPVFTTVITKELW